MSSLSRSVILALAALVAALTAPGARAAGVLTLEVDPPTVDLYDVVRVTVTIGGMRADELEDVDTSSFKQLSSETQVGRMTRRSYTLLATKAGTFDLGPVSAKFQGEVVATSNKATLVVRDLAAEPPRSFAEATAVPEDSDAPALLRWSLPRDRYYLGEPFALTLSLWLRSDLDASNPNLVKPPTLDGLLVEDLKIQVGRGERKILGRTAYDVYPLSAQLATPLRTGKLMVDAAHLLLTVKRGGGIFSQGEWQIVRSPAFPIEILDVPTQGRPAGFSPRNVGQFTMSAKLVDDRGAEATRVRTGQRMILRAEVQGQGNLVSLEAPHLVMPDAKTFEVQPLGGTTEDRVDKNVGGMSGARVFQWVVAVNQPGNLTTPGLRLETFDPVKQAFVTLAVPGRPIEATGSAVTPAGDQAASLGEDVGPIVETAALTSGPRSPLARSPIYWGALALPLVAFAWVEVRHRRAAGDRKNPGARAARGAGHNARKRLRAAEQALKDGLVKDFYGQLARTLTAYFEERANIPATGMTHHEVRQAARAAGYPAELADAWVVEMENCDFARFAPTGSAADKMREAAGRVSGLIDALEKITPERRP